MLSEGIDIGSRTIKLVVCDDGEIIESKKRENTFQTLEACRELLGNNDFDVITATGYGRHLFEINFGGSVISEIKAFSLGARALYPSCRTILDIGGQDIKAASLDQAGGLRKFEMNDKCSAGTGRFLEIMAMALGYNLGEFGTEALKAQKAERVNSMCTVFAESEVISLVSRGALREDVALGLHQAVAAKAKTLLSRVGIEDDLIFAGGAALNPCLEKLLEKSLHTKIHIPEDPQIVGAYGCAIYGLSFKDK